MIEEERKISMSFFSEKDKNICPKCNQDKFEVYIRAGAAGSGIYFNFVCSHCGEIMECNIDFPDYEG